MERKDEDVDIGRYHQRTRFSITYVEMEFQLLVTDCHSSSQYVLFAEEASSFIGDFNG